MTSFNQWGVSWHLRDYIRVTKTGWGVKFAWRHLGRPSKSPTINKLQQQLWDKVLAVFFIWVCPLFVAAAAGTVSAVGEKSSDGSSTEQAVTDEQSEQLEQSEDKVGTDSDEHDQVGWLSSSHQDWESQYSQPPLYSTLVYINDSKSIHPVYLIHLNTGYFNVWYSDQSLSTW